MEATKKKVIKITAIVLAAIIFLTAVVLSGLAIAHSVKADKTGEFALSYNGEKLNVILMIGDGMGPNHVKAAEAEYGELFFANNADQSGYVTTYSRNVFGPTDSAAAATALATGYKTDNGCIGQFQGKDLTTTAEMAVAKGMATGIIATEGVDGATPAGFSAHTSSRNNLDEILSDQLNSGIDLFFGSNSERYEPLKAQIKEKYAYVDSFSQIAATQGKIFAAFDEIPLKADGESKPTLASLAVAALDILSKDEDGFFLMIEESHIDKCSHNNDLSGALEHVKAYDNAIRAVVEYAERIGNTIVIVTADHETGGLTYNGETASQLNDGMYTKGSHTSANVPYYVFGDIDYEFADIIDNTQIAKLCQAVISSNKSR